MDLRLWGSLTFSLVMSHAALAAEPTDPNIEYAVIDGHALKLDLYENVFTDTPRPVVVWVHGGAWRRGSKDSVPATDWINNGFAIASIDYRLSPVAKFPAQIHDIKAAIRFLRANADEYDIDPKRVIVAGSSAGGHLAALVGLTNDVEELEGSVGDHVDQSSDVQATVSFYGASNLETILSQSTPHGLSVRVPALKLLLGDRPENVPALARLASPVTHVDATDPPLWLIHGDADPQMPIKQSQELAEACKQSGVPVDFETIPNAVHGGAEFYENDRLFRIGQAVLRVLDD